MKEWISLIAGIIALVTAIIGLVTSIMNTKKIKSLVDECQVELDINEPKEGDQVSVEIDVIGTSTINDKCRYVFIIVRGVASPQYWKVSDIVQINKNGKWSGIGLLDEIPVGLEAKIHARISSQPDLFRINQILSFPPVKGKPSNIIRLRRVQ